MKQESDNIYIKKKETFSLWCLYKTTQNFIMTSKKIMYSN